MLRFFNPSFQTFFFLKRGFAKLTNHLVPQPAMIATIKAVGVDREGGEKGEGEREPGCLQAPPSLSLGAGHPTQQVRTEGCTNRSSPLRHRRFQPSGSYCWGGTDSTSTHSFSFLSPCSFWKFPQHKCKHTFVLSGVKMKLKKIICRHMD